SDPRSRRRCDGDAARPGSARARPAGGGVSALAKKLAGLRRQAGGASAAGTRAPVARAAEAPMAAPATVSHQAPAEAGPRVRSREATVAQLRSLLKIRAPALSVEPRSIDRALPGEEIAPGLRLLEQRVPWAEGE